MCGINGFNWLDEKLIREMDNCLKHRGPDDEGVYTDKNLSLGHRRLSILDLSEKGKQPMVYSHKKKKVIVVYNGEIYNFLELKRELLKKGYSFKSGTDTEVILASYLEYGEECVRKFNGMWAFCVYDFNKKILFCSRDRLGKKPFYYYLDKNKFIFSSEIKGILKHNIEKQISRDAIDLYLSLGFIPAPHSIYKKISKLESGKNLIFNLKSKKIRMYSYYKAPFYNPKYNRELLIKEGKELLRDSVKLRLISDVSLGAFLSGGLDSSAIVSQMSSELDAKKLNTFSIGFEGEYDESKYSKIMKDYLGTVHHHKKFYEKDFKKIMESGELFFYYDEPFSENSMFPLTFLSDLTRENVVVALSGDGGDEIFGGYPRYKIASQLELIKKMPLKIRKLLLYFLKKICLPHSNPIIEGLKLSLVSSEKFYSEAREYIYKPEITKDILERKMRESLKLSGNNLVEAVRLMDLIFYTLPDRFLLNLDRASMAKSLEVRSPFLDYRFIKYSMKIPSEWKCSPFKTKILMRSIISGLLPVSILKRNKTGFTPPLIEWISKPSYCNDFAGIVERLFRSRIISKEWRRQFLEFIDKKDKVSQNYKIRLFLLFEWCKYWRII
jgi:asparagine synthase (glutamine-hydrolysing)